MKPNVKLRQFTLEKTLHKLFPNEEVIVESRKHANIISPSGNLLELDFWIPNLKLAFEFQEDHHYITSWYADRPHSLISGHDRIKKERMGERGETLVTIPCWWDGDEESLIATIRDYRPDLFSDRVIRAKPISEIPPDKFFKEKSIPDMGELMLASYTQSTTFQPRNWWMSEKYDGIRACWHAKKRILYKRRGGQINLPAQISKSFPYSHLDGEIWLGRNTFHDATKILDDSRFFDHPKFSHSYFWNTWSYARFVVFDSIVPDMEFERRYALVTSIDYESSFLTPCAHIRCAGKKHLRIATHQVIAQQGEGIIVRKNESLYTSGRSDDLVKIKAHRDTEGVVEEIHRGYYVVKLPNEGLVQVRAIPRLRAKIGQIVSFIHLPNRGQSKVAVLHKIRSDLGWEDLQDYDGDIVSEKSQRLIQESVSRPKGYWVKNDHEKIRQFFEEFFRSKGLDPRKPESFYGTKLKDVLEKKGGHSAVYHHRKLLAKVFLDVFPDIGLESSKFDLAEKNKLHRRSIFESFAAKRDLNPLVPENWYNIAPKDITQEKGGWNLMDHYGRNLRKALIDVFPDVNFVESRFARIRTKWSTKQPSDKRESISSLAKTAHKIHRGSYSVL